MSLYGRFEITEKETVSRVTALTVGAVRELRRWKGFEIGAGADVTGYAVPAERMWNMRMARPMS